MWYNINVSLLSFNDYEIEIEESLDTDKTYKSVIRVPMYCTPFIEEILFYSCQEYDKKRKYACTFRHRCKDDSQCFACE